MLKFSPPRITHINDVLPYIEGKPEIAVGYRDDYTMIDYMYAGKDTFDNVFARECRGLKFAPDGRLLARPFHKFHNLNEKEEYQEHLIDFSLPHVMLDKLDGSMVHTILLNGKVRLMTRKGFSEVALKAEKWLATLPEAEKANYNALMNGYPVSDFTHCFEYVAPHNQIVVFYEQESMILTAIRHIETGEYIRYDEMVAEAERCGVPVVQPYPLACFDEAAVRADPTNEGLVVRFADGSMVKVKAEVYCAKHGAVDSVSHCHGVLELAFANVLDDVLPNLSGEFKQRVIDYREAFFTALDQVKARIAAETDQHADLDQKAFALMIKDHPWKGHMFGYRKLQDINQVIDGYITRTSFKGKRVQDVCEELGLPYETDLGRW
jgi:RNA ligase